MNLNIGDLDSIEVTNSDVIFDLVNEDFGNDNLKNEEKEQKILLSADVLEINENNAELKTVNINLEENIENHDYKKFSINKLRNIVVEKGLSTDASKLKKNEMLKLLGAEQ